MRTQVFVRNRALGGIVFVAALAVALIVALQGLGRPFVPSIPLLERRIAPANVEASAYPAATPTVAPRVDTTALPAPAGAPASTALPAPLPKARPADGRPMGDIDPAPPPNRAWKGGFDY